PNFKRCNLRFTSDFLFSLPHRFGDLLPLEWNFRHQNDIGAAGHSPKKGNPSNVTAHDLQYHDPFMTHRRRMETIQCFRHTFDSRIESEGPRCRFEIVINCLRYADNRQSRLLKLKSGGQRTV